MCLEFACVRQKTNPIEKRYLFICFGSNEGKKLTSEFRLSKNMLLKKKTDACLPAIPDQVFFD